MSDESNFSKALGGRLWVVFFGNESVHVLVLILILIVLVPELPLSPISSASIGVVFLIHNWNKKC